MNVDCSQLDAESKVNEKCNKTSTSTKGALAQGMQDLSITDSGDSSGESSDDEESEEESIHSNSEVTKLKWWLYILVTCESSSCYTGSVTLAGICDF